MACPTTTSKTGRLISLIIAFGLAVSTLIPAGQWASASASGDPVYTVSPFAGNGEQDNNIDGTGTQAEFRLSISAGMVVASGTAYIAAYSEIRVVSLSSGVVSTLAGSSDLGCVANANPSVVEFEDLGDITTDGTYLYIADYGCQVIWKVSLASGSTTSLTSIPSGSGSHITAGPPGVMYLDDATTSGIVLSGVDESSGTTTGLTTIPPDNPGDALGTGGLAYDTNGLWLAGSDATTRTSHIWHIDPQTGATTTLVSDSALPFASPTLTASGGYLYTAAGQNGDPESISRYDETSGAETTLAGSGSAGYEDGTGTDAWFDGIGGIGVDGASIFVLDVNNGRLRQAVRGTGLPAAQLAVDSQTLTIGSGLVTTFAGDPGHGGYRNGYGDQAEMDAGAGPVVVNGVAYIAAGNQIRTVNLSTGYVGSLAGFAGGSGCVDSTNPQSVNISQPGWVDTDGHYLYVTDSSCRDVHRIALNTGATSTLTSLPAFSEMTVGPDGDVYVGENLNNSLVIYSVDANSGAKTVFSTIAPDKPGDFMEFGQMVSDSSHLWVGGVDWTTKVSHIWAVAYPSADVSTLVSDPTTPWQEPVMASAGDNLYVSPGGYTIVRYDKITGVSTLVAGSTSSEPGYVDGVGSQATFREISGIASDGTSLWVTDGDTVLRRVSAGTVGAAITDGNLLGQTNPSWPCGCATRKVSQAGDPVDAQIGNFSETVHDLSIPGRGRALDFSRTYNSDPVASSLPGPLGYGWSYTYGMSLAVSGSTATVTQENGSQVSFSESGSTFSPTQPQTEATLTATNGGYLFVRRAQQNFTFDANGQLTSESGLNGYTTTIAYPSPTQTVVTDPAGRTLMMTLSGGHIVSVADTSGRTVSFGYNDGNGDLTDVIDVDGGHTLYTYSASHQLLTTRTPRFYQDTTTTPTPVVTNAYDSSGRVSSQTDQIGGQTTFDYASVPGSTKITDRMGNVTLDTFTDGLLSSQTQGYGSAQAATWNFGYDPISGGVSEVVDPKGHISQRFYDAKGNVVTSVDALGRVTTFAYNGYNQVTAVTPPAAYGSSGPVSTTYGYDEAAYSSGGAGNLTTVSTPIVSPSGASEGTQVTHYVHADVAHPGDVTSMIDPDGNVWAYTYDAYGDQTSRSAPVTTDNSDSSGAYRNTTKWAYNTATGWMTATLSGRYTLAHPADTTCTPPATGCSAFSHDNMGRVLASTDGNAHTTTNHYDADGNLADVIDAAGHKTTFTYDPAGQLEVTTRPDASTVKTGYWADGSVADHIDATGADTHYSYDALGHLASVTDPDGRVTSYVYDAVGDLVAKGDPGTTACTASSTVKGCTVWSYDAGDEMTSVAYHDPATADVAAVGYDGDGRKASMTDGTGTSTWSYDSLGRLGSTTDGSGATLSYGYDPAGHQSSVVYPGSAGTVTRSFDAEGRQASVTDWKSNTTTFSYDADGDLTSGADPTTGASPVVDSTTYDPADQVSAMTTVQGPATSCTSVPPSASCLGSQTYTRDPLGQVSSEADTGLPAPPSQSYTYDSVDRLQSANASGYSYDAAGNPVGVGTDTAQSFDAADQLTTSNSQTGAQVAAGTWDSYGVRADGTVWGAGANNAAQLGSYSGSQSNVGVPIAGISAATAVTSGLFTAAAVTTGGGLQVWGAGTQGELGNGTTTSAQTAPVTPTGMASGVSAVSMNPYGEHVLAVAGGAAYAWGSDVDGQVGNGTTATAVSTPYELSSITATVVGVAAGTYHSLALTSAGQVWAWGDNTYGALGDGTTTAHTSPELLGGISGVTALAAGDGWSMALKSDGTVWTWGDNTYGELGHATSTPDVPTEVAGLGTKTAAISAGLYHALVLGADGAVSAWGMNNYGQVGAPAPYPATQATPLTVVASGATAISAGYAHSIATMANGTVQDWGYNGYGQLANNTTTLAHTPTDTAWLAANNQGPATTAAGTWDSYGVRADGTVWGAGANNAAQLGSYSGSQSNVGVPIAGISAATAVTSGLFTAAAVTTGGGLQVWGAGTQGELGNGTTTSAQTAPVTPTGMASGVSAVSMNPYGEHVLAVAGGAAYAWGSDVDGQVGNGTTATAVSTPYELSSITATVVGVAAGTYHSLALTSAGQVWAWGDNTYGALGDGTTTAHTSPELLGGISGVTALAAGDGWSMALKSDGTVWTWGDNTYGELGHATSTPDVPTEVAGLGTKTAAISAGLYHALVLGADGAVSAWGMNNYGQVGAPAPYPATQATPLTVVASGATAISAGYAHSIATMANGTVQDWGYNGYGQLANNTTTLAHTPTDTAWLAANNQTLTRYSYDDRGELTAIVAPFAAPVSLTYDEAGRLTAYGTVATYSYDGDGLRTTKTVGGSTQHFTYDTTGSTPSVLTDATNAYLYGPDGNPLEQMNLKSGSLTWYHHDQIGSTRTLTDNAGAIVGTATYNPYGQPTATAGITTPLGYAGAYTDPETGLIYLINRYYDAATGQFLNVDPLVATTNAPYTYAGDDPVNKSDPTGLMPCLPNGPCGSYQTLEKLSPCAYGDGASSAQPSAPPPPPQWELWRVIPEQGDTTVFVPTATDIEVQIQDFTGVTGEFSVSDSFPPQTQGFLARWSLIPGLSSTTSGKMSFYPAFGQDGYDLDIKYHPWAATAEGDTADATYVVKIYEPGFCGPNGCQA